MKCADALSLDMCDSVTLCMNSAVHVLVCTMLSHTFALLCSGGWPLVRVTYPLAPPTLPLHFLTFTSFRPTSLTSLNTWMRRLWRNSIDSWCHSAIPVGGWHTGTSSAVGTVPAA